MPITTPSRDSGLSPLRVTPVDRKPGD